MKSTTTLLITLLSFLLLFQSTQAFCIYNRLFEGSPNIKVFQSFLSGKAFSKVLARDEIQCCHYSDRGCNKSGSKNSYLSFFVTIDGQTHADIAHCVAGGSLSFRGTSMDDISAVCVYPDGFVFTSIIRL